MDVELVAWKMYFEAINQYENRIRTRLAIKLNFEATNNMAEYETCIARMEALWELGVKEAEVFRDSTLVIAQTQKLCEVKEEHLKPYQQYLEDFTKTFDKIKYTINPKA